MSKGIKDQKKTKNGSWLVERSTTKGICDTFDFNFLVADNQIGHIYVNMDKKVVIVSIFRYHLAHLLHMKKKEDKKCIICSFKKGQYF
jgi:hypothetical protein